MPRLMAGGYAADGFRTVRDPSGVAAKPFVLDSNGHPEFLRAERATSSGNAAPKLGSPRFSAAVPLSLHVFDLSPIQAAVPLSRPRCLVAIVPSQRSLCNWQLPR